MNRPLVPLVNFRQYQKIHPNILIKLTLISGTLFNELKYEFFKLNNRKCVLALGILSAEPFIFSANILTIVIYSIPAVTLLTFELLKLIFLLPSLKELQSNF